MPRNRGIASRPAEEAALHRQCSTGSCAAAAAQAAPSCQLPVVLLTPPPSPHPTRSPCPSGCPSAILPYTETLMRTQPSCARMTWPSLSTSPGKPGLCSVASASRACLAAAGLLCPQLHCRARCSSQAAPPAALPHGPGSDTNAGCVSRASPRSPPHVPRSSDQYETATTIDTIINCAVQGGAVPACRCGALPAPRPLPASLRTSGTSSTLPGSKASLPCPALPAVQT